MAAFDSVSSNAAGVANLFPFLGCGAWGSTDPDVVPVEIASAEMTSDTNLRLTLASAADLGVSARIAGNYIVTSVDGYAVTVSAVAAPVADGSATVIDLAVSRHTNGETYTVTVNDVVGVVDGANANYAGEAAAPTFTVSVLNNTQIRLDYSTPMFASSAALATNFDITDSAAYEHTIDGASYNGGTYRTTLTMTLGHVVGRTTTVTGQADLRDLQGNPCTHAATYSTQLDIFSATGVVVSGTPKARLVLYHRVALEALPSLSPALFAIARQAPLLGAINPTSLSFAFPTAPSSGNQFAGSAIDLTADPLYDGQNYRITVTASAMTISETIDFVGDATPLGLTVTGSTPVGRWGGGAAL